MAIMRQSIQFGGVNSADFGIYIGGEGTFDAPKRAVEVVNVPGRNGAITLDQGYYENIEVTYSAYIYVPGLENFADTLRDFRNALVAQRGYQRLVDTFHPEEYRLAMFVDGIEIKPIMHNTAAEFEIKFNCKPQRFLMDGESAMTVSDGQSVFNPTPFESQPLLAIEGYGTIGFNGYEVAIENATMGDIILSDPTESSSGYLGVIFDKSLLETGDPIYLTGLEIYGYLTSSGATLTSVSSITDSQSGFSTTYTGSQTELFWLTTRCGQLTFTAGTDSTITDTTVIKVVDNGVTKTITRVVEVTYEYDMNTLKSRIKVLVSYTSDSGVYWSNRRLSQSGTNATSSVSILGNPTYIDCELGEAYMIKDGSFISLNEYIDLGSDLPTLAPGNNEFDIANTMTDVQLTPRWWIL